MANEPAQESLLRLFDQLSLGDLSVLELAFQKPGAGLTTMAGSANDNLWREFAALGWMTREERALSQTVSILLYEVTPLGEPPIRQLFAEFMRRRSSAGG
jgi:hypothetical protein